MKNIAEGLVLALVLGFGLPACGGKVQQCNKLIEEINKAQEQFSKAGTALTDKEEAKKIHDELEAEIAKIEGVEISDEKLKGFQQRWVDGLNELNKQLEKASSVGEDPAAAMQLARDVTNTTNQLSSLVNETNGYCQGTN